MEETFKITDDKSADWAIRQIHEAEDERDRLVSLAEEQIIDLNDRINELKSKCDSDTAYLKSCLIEYFQTIKPKETKTQKTYKLISGTLVFKKPSVKITHNDDKLLEYLKANDGDEFIKVKESIDWAEFKKGLTVSDSGEVIDSELGTIIPNEVCAVEDVPASFNIKY
jgi:phage host-nuclease inhibitor protein Gam